MLIGIKPCIGPELLKTLAQMGHGDELVLADAYYPGHTMGKRCIRADGITIPQLLEGILPLITLDTFVKDSVVMMAPVEGDTADPEIEKNFMAIIKSFRTEAPDVTKISREEFYERAKNAYAVVMSSSCVKYGCIILKKGVPLGTE